MYDEIKQENLNEIISRFSEKLLSEEELGGYIADLTDIYDNDFRHRYAKISGLIIKNDADNKASRYFLIGNMELIKSLIEKSSMPDAQRKSFYKLEDHISLETSRLVQNDSVKEGLANTAKTLSGLNKNMVSVKSQVEQAGLDIEKSKYDVTAVLGIFASIILTFSGSISFSNAIFNGLTSKTDFRILIILGALLGIVVFNSLAFMMKFVHKIVFKAENAKMYDWIIVLVTVVLIVIMIIFYNIVMSEPTLNIITR